MSYSVTIPISLGAARADLDLTAKLYDFDDVQVGTDITTGFSGGSGGYYVWRNDAIPDNFAGTARFFTEADGEIVRSVVTVDAVQAMLTQILAGVQAFNPASVPNPSNNLGGNGKSMLTYQGDDYTAGSPHGPYDWTAEDDDAWPDLTGATVVFTSSRKSDGVVELTAAGSIVNPTGPAKTIRVEMTAAQTATLTPGSTEDGANPKHSNAFEVRITLDGGDVWTPIFGGAPGISGGHTIIKDQSP